MYKSIVFLALSLLVLSACNRKQKIVQEAPQEIVTPAPAMVEKPEETEADKLKNATTVIEKFGKSIELTETQKAAIKKMASEFDFDSNNAAGKRAKWKEFRKQINQGVLTEEQRQQLKTNRKNNPRKSMDGK